jgi:hypothetical protein
MDHGISQSKDLSEYRDFIKSKVRLAKRDGFDVDDSEINPILKPHQRACVRWAVAGGRRALFESFGLGKSVQQLEILRIILKKLGTGRALIVAPLGVRQEFKRDAIEKLGWDAPPTFVRRSDEADAPGIYITNYESVRDGKLDPNLFDVVSLDEASCLRGFGGTKTFREFMALFAGDRKTMDERTFTDGIKYRFVATATPSPNEYIELLAYSAFLGIMEVSAAKTRFFKRDSTKADNLTLHPHKASEFWLWVASWAIFLESPADLGFDSTGYDLPAMNVHFHQVAVDHTDAKPNKFGQFQMFRDATVGLVEAAREKRETLHDRIGQMVEIITNEFTVEGGVPAAILPEKSGEAACGSEGTRSQELSGQPAKVRGKKQKVARGKSGTVQSSNEKVRSAEPGESEAGFCGMVSGEQGPGECDESPEQAEEVRDRSGNLRENVCGSERQMPDLPSSDGQAGSRPRSRNGSGPRSSVSGLQCSPGPVSGKSESAAASDPLFDQFLVWCDLNDEQRAIEKALDSLGISYSSIYGSLTVEEQEARLEQWRNREKTALIGKPSMLGSGVNLQQCNKAIFAGINYKFNDFYQATKRVHRYLQTRPVEIHIIYAESEKLVLQALLDKWERDKEQRQIMAGIIKQYGLSHEAMQSELTRGFGVERAEIKGEHHTLVNNDSVEETRRMDANSVGLIVTSVPFSTQYEYSPNYNDFGHTDNNEHFFEQMDYLTPELLRVLQPGRIAAIHVKDRVVPGGLTGLGFQTVYPFHARCIEHYTRHGFGYIGMKTIVTDVVRENNQTYRLGWSEQCKDGTKMGVGMPEYLLMFRKPQTDNTKAYADLPVVKSKDKYSRSRWQIDAHGFTRSSGNRLLTPEEMKSLPHSTIFKLFRKYSLENVYDFEKHVELSESLEACTTCHHIHTGSQGACNCGCKGQGRLPTTFMLLQPQSWHPDVWSDITRMLTLNSKQYSMGRQMHLCPMQFDIVDRAINQWTNPGELVLDPFGGIGTVAYRSVLLGRRGYSIELNRDYFLDSIVYCETAEQKSSVPTLFDLEEVEVIEEVAA